MAGTFLPGLRTREATTEEEAEVVGEEDIAVEIDTVSGTRIEEPTGETIDRAEDTEVCNDKTISKQPNNQQYCLLGGGGGWDRGNNWGDRGDNRGPPPGNNRWKEEPQDR